MWLVHTITIVYLTSVLFLLLFRGISNFLPLIFRIEKYRRFDNGALWINTLLPIRNTYLVTLTLWTLFLYFVLWIYCFVEGEPKMMEEISKELLEKQD